MRKLIESTHVALGGEIGSPQDWAFPYLDDEHTPSTCARRSTTLRACRWQRSGASPVAFWSWSIRRKLARPLAN